MRLQVYVRELVEQHGSIAKTAEATGISPAHIRSMMTNERVSPSKAMIAKLGLTRTTTYAKADGTEFAATTYITDGLLERIRLFGEQCYQDGKVNNEYETDAHKTRYAELIALLRRELRAP